MFKNSETLRLDQIAEVTMGQSPDSSSYNSVGKGIPFYQGKTEFTDKYIGQPSTWCTSPTRIAKENDILMSVRAPVGNVNIATEECCIGRGLSSIRPQNGFNSEFIFEALEQKKEELENKATGSTFKAINKDIVLSIQIPNTSISIQKEYSNFVKQIDKSKFLLQQILEKLELLKKSRFIEMFIEKRYPTASLDELSICGGEYGAQSSAIEYHPNRPRYVRITDINEDGSLNNDYASSANIKDDEQYRLKYGDFLFARMGATVGKTYAYTFGDQIYAGYLIRYRLNLEKILPEYLFAFTRLNCYWKWVSINQNGAAQPGINAKKYGSLYVPVPPIEEQKKFIELSQQIDKSKFNVFQDQTASQVKVIVVLHHIC